MEEGGGASADGSSASPAGLLEGWPLNLDWLTAAFSWRWSCREEVGLSWGWGYVHSPGLGLGWLGLVRVSSVLFVEWLRPSHALGPCCAVWWARQRTKAEYGSTEQMIALRTSVP